MGMDRTGDGGSFRFNTAGWGQMLHLAEMSGWEPAGTKAPDLRDENGEADGRYGGV